MKKLLLAALILAFAIPAYAEHYEVTFAWEQADTDLPNLSKWTLFMSGGPSVQVIDIIYDESAGPTFTSEQQFTIDVVPDVPVQRSFYLTAWSKNGAESGPSNTVTYTFETDWLDVTVPQTLRITGVVVVGD